MPRTPWLRAMICAAAVGAAGCATTTTAAPAMRTADAPPVEVRNYEGEVLPPYALNDATSHTEVECLDGQVYEIVDRPQELYGAANKTTAHARPPSIDDICDRILNSRTERRTR